MIIVLIILTILAIFLGIITIDDYVGVSFTSFIGAVILGIFDIIIIGIIIFHYTNGLKAKPKIKMYEEENKKIEEKINILVLNYMEYEGKTLKEFKSSNSMLLVNLYPELKSDKLVEEQIKIYNENNKKIKELKEEEIDIRIGKWLLYFGGNI